MSNFWNFINQGLINHFLNLKAKYEKPERGEFNQMGS